MQSRAPAQSVQNQLNQLTTASARTGFFVTLKNQPVKLKLTTYQFVKITNIFNCTRSC